MGSEAQLFVWQDYYVLGLAEIDAQHRRIFEIAGQLHASILAAGRREAVTAQLCELHAAMEAHFRAEEAIMRDRQYGPLMQHKQEHAGFLERLALARNQVESGREEVTPSVLRAFNEWVSHHLCGADAVMAATLTKTEVPVR